MGMWNSTTTLERSLAASQQVKRATTHDPAIPRLPISPRVKKVNARTMTWT